MKNNILRELKSVVSSLKENVLSASILPAGRQGHPRFNERGVLEASNKYLLLFVGIILLALTSFLLFGSSKTTSSIPSSGSNSDIILFYGESCPHCKNVDAFLSENKVAEKVKFDQKEVFNNQENAKLLMQKAVTCNLKSDSVPVPFLWDGSKCVIGDTDVINFFKEKIK